MGRFVMIRVMIALKAHFDGKVFVPDEPLDLAPNQQVRLQVETIDSPAPAIHPDSISHPQKVDLSKLRGAALVGPTEPSLRFPDEDSLWEGTTGNYLENGPNKPGQQKPSR